MRNSTVIGRVAAVGAIAIAIIAVAVILLQGGKSYQVNAVFINASQLVAGDEVDVAGSPIGTVSQITLTPQGQARLTLDIKQSNYMPLRQGTIATVRETSLSGIANRYVDLRLGPGNAQTIPNGGTIGTKDTTSAVDLDQIFNTLDPATRKGLQDFIQGSAAQYQGKGKAAQAAFAYLDPAIAASSMLFRELNRNTAKFTNFIVKTGNLFTDISQRQSDVSGLVTHLSTTLQALAAQHGALGNSIAQLPGFMALADTTFVNLRNALNDITPLVNVSKPVAPKLQKLLVQLEPLAIDSVPTVRDLANVIRRPGAYNDLTELTALGQPLAAATVRKVRANGKVRNGAFPESAIALNQSTPELAIARPYSVDLTGWFEGYTHPGTIDANGGASRIAPVIGVGSLQNGVLNLLPAFANPVLRSLLAFGNPSGNSSSSGALLTTGQGDRCPGSMERGAVWYPYRGYPCNPREVPTGP